MKSTIAERTSRRLPASLGKSNAEAAALVPNGTYPDPPPIADALSDEAMTADVATAVQMTPDSRADGEDVHARIAERAYLRYLSRNGEEGDALNDWLQAEAELRADAHSA
ncbi:MAG: DUF2934 domain-containing protein [Acidobacteria bacterium]|nr:DUF2934 domain-containing protein [Acidobacteriota bacterium]